MRLHHYAFSHRVLPAELQAGDGTLGLLANPDNLDYLVRLWECVPRNKAYQELRLRYESQLDLLIPGQPVSQDVNAVLAAMIDVLPPNWLGYNTFWLGGQHLVFLIQMPEPLALRSLVAITTSPRSRSDPEKNLRRIRLSLRFSPR
jgi:hypothetical protein